MSHVLRRKVRNDQTPDCRITILYELTALSQNWVDYIGYTVSDGLPIPFSPEPAAYLFLGTFAIMVIAGVWVNLSKD